MGKAQKTYRRSRQDILVLGETFEVGTSTRRTRAAGDGIGEDEGQDELYGVGGFVEEMNTGVASVRNCRAQ